jgi:hypothetical protein
MIVAGWLRQTYTRCLAALAVAANFFLFLLPNERPWWRLAGIADEETTEVLGLFFASSRAAATDLLNYCGMTQIDHTIISHGDH